MIRVLYIGNHLSSKNAYPSVGESMSSVLLPEISLRLVSSHRNKVLRILDMLLAVIRFGPSEQPVFIDVYSTTNFYYALLSASLCRILGIRYCCILHGGNLPDRLNRYPSLCRQLFGYAYKLISPSGYLQQAFIHAGYKGVQVIPNFIPIELYPFRLREQISPRLLWVRAFDATYNPTMAIRILVQLIKTHPDAQLCMVGPDKDGSMKVCQELAETLGVKDRVKFTGKLSKAEWVALAEGYDIFINTTNFDNTPVSVIEAMALGLPVVSTNVGGIPFLIDDGQTGLLTPPDDVVAFVHQIIYLLDNLQITSRLIHQGRTKVETFSWEMVRPLWLDAIRSKQPL